MNVQASLDELLEVLRPHTSRQNTQCRKVIFSEKNNSKTEVSKIYHTKTGFIHNAKMLYRNDSIKIVCKWCQDG